MNNAKSSLIKSNSMNTASMMLPEGESTKEQNDILNFDQTKGAKRFKVKVDWPKKNKMKMVGNVRVDFGKND